MVRKQFQEIFAELVEARERKISSQQFEYFQSGAQQHRQKSGRNAIENPQSSLEIKSMEQELQVMPIQMKGYLIKTVMESVLELLGDCRVNAHCKIG